MSQQDGATKAAPNGRLANGQFTKGNAGGPGNPHAGKVARLRAVLIEAVTEEDIQEIAGQLVALAKEGNMPAIKLLFQYTLGKPGAVPEPATGPQPPAAPASAPRAVPEVRPELLKEIERSILQPSGALPRLVADIKRESGTPRDDQRRR
jgi:hypothetical protein